MNSHNHPHVHTHGVIDPSILVTKRGIWAVKWSFIALMATTIIQALVVYFSGSVALLGDTVHNLGDAFTAIPIGLAFIFGQKNQLNGSLMGMVD
jgi:divalent metal cation (Fe/Co/Zn/Cd) transporter